MWTTIKQSFSLLMVTKKDLRFLEMIFRIYTKWS